MSRVIYLMALEKVFNNAIFENRVKKLLLKIKREHGEGLELTLVVLLPWIELTRRGPYSNFKRYKNELDSLRQELFREGIRLVAVRTLFPSAFFNMKAPGLAWFSLITLPVVWYLILTRRAQVIHCRYYYASFVALLAARLSPQRVKVIFDVRSLLPEQGVVNGDWSAGSFTFRFWKAVERWMFKSADLSVAVSPAMASRIKEENPQALVETIPNFVDIDAFKPDPVKRDQSRRELNIEKRRVLVFSGTVGKRYPAGRIAEAVQIFFRIFGQESFFLLLSPSDEKRLAPLADALASRGLKRGESWVCLKAPPEEVPFYLNAADWALLVLADYLSGETATPRDDYVFPIKFAEYLALGLPIFTHPSNRGMREIIQSYGVGTVLDNSLPPEKLRVALEQNEAQMREHCLETARNDFPESRSVIRYSEHYIELAA